MDVISDTFTVGGSADDEFVFLSVGDGVDIILDFALASNDRLDLSAIFAGQIVDAGNLSQYIQASVLGIGADSFLAVDANGLTGGLRFTIIAQVIGITTTELFNIDNFVL